MDVQAPGRRLTVVNDNRCAALGLRQGLLAAIMLRGDELFEMNLLDGIDGRRGQVGLGSWLQHRLVERHRGHRDRKLEHTHVRVRISWEDVVAGL